jgi:hypothetical protein
MSVKDGPSTPVSAVVPSDEELSSVVALASVVAVVASVVAVVAVAVVPVIPVELPPSLPLASVASVDPDAVPLGSLVVIVLSEALATSSPEQPAAVRSEARSRQQERRRRGE